ncbi:phosphoglycerate dehydrogenase [Pseudoalteromonas spongiae]|uniref:phosphoglycerate dehydrogenase n=1 Tax=Pseudoalteromonas spongiae TaxID=298657 RepID=UPI000C2D3018|nr:phosphoglycerate dehydrogenase [Pseudoalteromonas spongiae]
MMRVLVTNIMMLNEQERFSKEITSLGYEPVFMHTEQFFTESELLDIVGDYDGWLAGDDQITEQVLKKALPRLKVISKWGTGIDSIDLNAAKELGIPVLNSPGAFKDAVSEVAIAYMLNLSRHVVSIDRSIRQGSWPKPAGVGLVNRKLGIIGFGAIGQGVAERALGLKMDVVAYDSQIQESLADYPQVNMLPFDDVIAQSDVVCLCCNMSPENVHMINEQVIEKMKDGACIINVARGPLIDESALIAALESKKLSSAGLDVFETEPLPVNSKLFSFDNVILGSHNANNLVSATEYVHSNTLKNLAKVLG